MQPAKSAVRMLSVLAVMLPGLANAAGEPQNSMPPSTQLETSLTSLGITDISNTDAVTTTATTADSTTLPGAFDSPLKASAPQAVPDTQETIKSDAAHDKVAPSARAAEATVVAGMGTAVALDNLDHYRGGTDVSNSILPLGAVKNNTAVDVMTGVNSISEGAFSNASGLPIVIQNSGNNVLIQNSTIVNVQFK